MYNSPRLAAFALTSLVLSTSLVAAAPRPRQDELCRTVYSGVLSVDVNGSKKPLSLGPDATITYDPTGQTEGLQVEYINCDSYVPDPSFVSGMFRLPGTAYCINVYSQANAVGPYFTNLDSCEDNIYAYGKQFVNFNGPDDGFSWTGKSDKEGTVHQGGCIPSLLGIELGDDGAPIVNQKTDGIEINCAGSKFYLS